MILFIKFLIFGEDMFIKGFLIFLYQVPEDTKDVKVGTLIAVLAPEGEDWKTIEIPAGEESAASATTAEDTPAAAAAGGGHAHGYAGIRLFFF